jgi:hypothetical protein
MMLPLRIVFALEVIGWDGALRRTFLHFEVSWRGLFQ